MTKAQEMTIVRGIATQCMETPLPEQWTEVVSGQRVCVFAHGVADGRAVSVTTGAWGAWTVCIACCVRITTCWCTG